MTDSVKTEAPKAEEKPVAAKKTTAAKKAAKAPETPTRSFFGKEYEVTPEGGHRLKQD